MTGSHELWLRAAACLMVLATVVICVSAQTRPAPQFRTGVTLVELEVTVIDGRGLPVAGLTKTDFSVFENGSPRTVVNAIEVGSPGTQTAGTELLQQSSTAPAESRIVTVILDDAQIPANPRVAQQAKAIARTVIQSLDASDNAALVFTRRTGQSADFTTNHAKLIETVNGFVPAPSTGSAPTSGAAIMYEIRTSLNALESVVRYIGTMSGRRKAIFYVSTGVALPRQGSQAFNEVIQALRRVFDTAQAQNVMIYGLDPGGLSTGPETRIAGSSTPGVSASGGLTSRHEFLLMLAENTGGRSIVDRNNPEKAVVALLTEHSHYYQVAYESSLVGAERPRKIEVRINRRGAAARFRSMNTPWQP